MSSDPEHSSAAKEEVTMQGRGTIVGQQSYEVSRKARPAYDFRSSERLSWCLRGHTFLGLITRSHY